MEEQNVRFTSLLIQLTRTGKINTPNPPGDIPTVQPPRVDSPNQGAGEEESHSRRVRVHHLDTMIATEVKDFRPTAKTLGIRHQRTGTVPPDIATRRGAIPDSRRRLTRRLGSRLKTNRAAGVRGTAGKPTQIPITNPRLNRLDTRRIGTGRDIIRTTGIDIRTGKGVRRASGISCRLLRRRLAWKGTRLTIITSTTTDRNDSLSKGMIGMSLRRQRGLIETANVRTKGTVHRRGEEEEEEAGPKGIRSGRRNKASASRKGSCRVTKGTSFTTSKTRRVVKGGVIDTKEILNDTKGIRKGLANDIYNHLIGLRIVISLLIVLKVFGRMIGVTVTDRKGSFNPRVWGTFTGLIDTARSLVIPKGIETVAKGTKVAADIYRLPRPLQARGITHPSVTFLLRLRATIASPKQSGRDFPKRLLETAIKTGTSPLRLPNVSFRTHTNASIRQRLSTRGTRTCGGTSDIITTIGCPIQITTSTTNQIITNRIIKGRCPTGPWLRITPIIPFFLRLLERIYAVARARVTTFKRMTSPPAARTLRATRLLLTF